MTRININLSSYLRKYLVFGTPNCSKDPLVILEEAIEGGITAFQFREKGPFSLNWKEKVNLGSKLRKLCHINNVLFIVNDDLDLAQELESDGVHVGQGDMNVEKIKRVNPHLLVGLSVSTLEEVKKSSMEKIDYIGAGPVFSTETKEDTKPVVGVKWIKQLKDLYPHLPVIGIGGINKGNVEQVLKAGADGIAFVSAVTKSNNIVEEVHQL